MKVLLLAGGLGSRLGEETILKPKPMVEIGGYPILWHIMKIYSYHGFNDFVILTGYKSHIIKDYFVNYYQRYSDLTVDMRTNTVSIHQTRQEPWKVTLLYTGKDTLTAGRIQRAQEFIGNEAFMLTYGDGVADIDIPALLKAHKQSGKLCTITAYQPEGKYGALSIDENGTISNFSEKPKNGGAWINAGFMICEPAIFNYFPKDADQIMFECEPLFNLSKHGQLHAYKHTGIWHPMDMLKDKNDLNAMWNQRRAPWKIWEG